MQPKAGTTRKENCQAILVHGNKKLSHEEIVWREKAAHQTRYDPPMASKMIGAIGPTEDF